MAARSTFANCVFSGRSVRRSTAAVLTAVSLAAASTAPGLAEGAWPTEVDAVYKIQFNGFEIGTFAFNSSVHGSTYSLRGQADISALLGVVRWQGTTQVSGKIAGSSPRPEGFAFDFRGSSKSGSVRMGFQNTAVRSLIHVPPLPPEPGIVPVQSKHLAGVLDPMSAVMAISRPKSGDPCNQRIAVFDGKLRFDLAFVFRSEETIAPETPGGQPMQARVCRVRYLPVAGHKADDATAQIQRATGIEVAFRPIPSAGLFVPHRITVPTPAGSAKLVSHKMRITTPRNGQIALVF